MAKAIKLALTGVEELDKKLRELAAETGGKSINGEMRKATREAIRQIVLPEVLALIPWET